MAETGKMKKGFVSNENDLTYKTQYKNNSQVS